eukprot:TRINITY_DN2817_c1_g1_i2.p1 TRINITY_DN2817_c1_g1~~TRINITY_DN2817_c1_g1_i2.p1  ORF type:complete len:714 (-),score=172.97 TRINITY_DN2817_c1_g1_i2:1743-3734(-)
MEEEPSSIEVADMDEKESMDDTDTFLSSQFSGVGLNPKSCSKCSFLSLEEYEEAASNPVGEQVIQKANVAISKLKQEINKLKTRADTAEITMSALLDQIDKESKSESYKEQYLQLKKDHNKLMLSSMKVNQELEELQKTTGHAIGALGDRPRETSSVRSRELEAFERAVQEDENNAPTGKLDVFNDIAALLEDMDRKMTISTSEVSTDELRVMVAFFERLKQQKQEDRMRIDDQIATLDGDIRRAEEQLRRVMNSEGSKRDPFSTTGVLKHPERSRKRKGNDMDEMADDEIEDEKLAAKKMRVLTNLDTLGETYFETRSKDDEPFKAFHERISEFTRYDDLKVLGTFLYTPSSGIQSRSQSTIVSSVAFHVSEDFFAVAGTLGEIHIMPYDLENIQNEDESLTPLQTINNVQKLSCVGYSPAQTEQLASTDYAGVVALWDSNSGRSIRKYTEHKKRTWCVDWSLPSPGLFGSASEDYTVKLWDPKSPKSVQTLSTTSEVCSIKFNRVLDNQLVFSCADHKAYYYDIRNPSTPMSILHGHRKTVCDVSFLTREELITQSIDSTLKLWNLSDVNKIPRKTFIGHENKMRFTGMDCAHDLISCGSENNSVMVYVRSHEKPILTHSFASVDKEKDYGAFVSAVTWRRQSRVMIVGNSRGIVKVLGLT